MAKQATDAEVMEYLWPTEREAQGEQAMNNPKITSVGIAAALLLFSALLFGERAEAGALFPEGTYDKGNRALEVQSVGEYLVTSREGVTTTVIAGGFALHEGHEVCFYGDLKGNLWTVSDSGTGACYQAHVRGNRLIIDNLGDSFKILGGVWTKR